MSEKYPVLNCFVAKQTAMKHTVIMILVYALSGVPGETGMLCMLDAKSCQSWNGKQN